MVYVKKYARQLIELENLNLIDRVDWTDKQYALNGNTTQEAYSLYTEKKTWTNPAYDKREYVPNIPAMLSARDFGLEIPEDAKINYIRFNVGMRASEGLEVLKPIGRFMIYGGTGEVEDVGYKQTGWASGIYTITPTDYLPQHPTNLVYEMSGDVYDQRKNPSTALNEEYFALYFHFREARKFKKESPIYLNYVYVEVDYTESETTILFDPFQTTGDEPYHCLANEEFDLNIIFKQNIADAGSKTFNIDIPWGTEIVSYSATSGTFNPNTRKYTLNLSPNSENTLTLRLNPNGIGLKELKVYNTNQSASFYYHPSLLYDTNYFTANIVSDGIRKNYRSCITFNIQSESSVDTQTFRIGFTQQGSAIPTQRISTSLNKELTTKGITLDSVVRLDNLGNNPPLASRYLVTLSGIPTGQKNDIVLNFCCYPKTTGDFTVTITDDALNEQYSQTFQSLDPYIYRLGNSDKITSAYWNFKCISEDIVFKEHRMASDVVPWEDTVFLACEFDEVDSVMTISDCNLTAHFYEEVDYIGCVPLEQTHFDPKSTYKDKLLDSRYKNKRYMGKQLASDEDITLNVRLHPPQVTTIQGLIDMDKPIPINANHKCFEGDSLNHRGWAEIYGIKTEQTGNNPHWYKCDIDVKYITHNLNTRFNIHRGVKSYPMTVPDLLVPVNTPSDTLYDFFNVRTDGTYEFREDRVIEEEGQDPIIIEYDENKRHKVELDSGQSLFIQTKSPLANRVNLTVDWISNKLAEDKENLITRIFRIRDKKTNQVVFEYEYSDWDFSDVNYIGTTVKGRQLYKGSYDPLAINKQIDMRREESSDVDPQTGEIIIDDDEVYFGSKIHFQINNKKLTVIDEGFNGKELTYTSTKNLEGANYVFEVEMKNNNEDAETDDVITFINISVDETLLNTARFSEYYDHMVVSPFPVADRKVLFIRQAEEGNIYYLEDEGLKEFSYLIDPYYNYKNGVDLQSYDGTSLFSLNYGYEMIFLQNGLVRLGINRINGSINLAKYDKVADDYIITSRFKLANEKDVGITYISDDKIVLYAGDSKFTMWRGHPYVMVNHNGEDLIILNSYYRVWGESVGGDVSEYPCYWDLMNSRNLLPSNIGGNLISSKDMTIEELEVAHLDLNIYPLTNPIYSNEDIELEIEGEIDSFSENIIIDDSGVYKGVLGEYTYEVQTNTGYVTGTGVMIEKPVIKTGEEVNISGFVYNHSLGGISGKTINIYSSNYESFRDVAKGTNHNTNWYNHNNRISTTYTSEGTYLGNSSGTLGFYLASTSTISDMANAKQFNLQEVEFKVVNFSDNAYIQIIDDSSPNIEIKRTMSQLSAVEGDTIKITCYDGDVVRFYVNGSLRESIQTVLGTSRVGFRVDDGAYIKFCDFRVTEKQKLIGQGTTNSNGEYQTTLTGQGNGKKDIWAYFNGLESSKETLIDADFYDPALSTNYLNEWYNHYNRISAKRADNYTSLINKSLSIGFYSANKVGTPKTSQSDVTEWLSPFHLEFDVIDYTGGVYIQIYDDKTLQTYYRSFSSLGIKQGSHVSLSHNGTIATYDVDGTIITRDVSLGGKVRIEFRLDSDATLKFRDFILWDSDF